MPGDKICVGGATYTNLLYSKLKRQKVFVFEKMCIMAPPSQVFFISREVKEDKVLGLVW